ncbi:unnamed protein product [Periconia digitata]|uniref:Uncharacterized protein n=1 Tax=Periconia digitata TaxID=1303443 RepID=A0A9W4URI9_9PLEO|nr:unnamed protein product [Periconia digitata]
MAEGRATRRARGQRKSYNIDPLAGLELEDGSDGEARGEEEANGGAVDDGVSSDEFEMGQEEEDADEFMEEDGMAGEDEDDDDGSAESVGDAASEADEGGVSVPKRRSAAAASTAKAPTERGKKKKKKGPERPSKKNAFGKGSMIQWRSQSHRIATAVKIRQRGVDEWMPAGQAIRFKMYFGPTVEDIYPALQTRDYFKFQEIFPSRSQGSLMRSFYLAEDARMKEIKITREWYKNSGQAAFSSGQQTQILTGEEWKPYMYNTGPETMDLLMGDATAPKLYTLKKGEFMKAAEPFAPNTNRRGWIFNLGARIHEAQWAPNEEGRTQYLAVAVEQKSTKKSPDMFENSSAPAFTATGTFPASIQIWAFESLENGDMDPEKAPRLEHVICTDWGAPKRLAWSPIGPDDEAVHRYDENGEVVRLGLLAGIWSDGKLRIIDISFQKPETGTFQTVYTHYSQAAFDVDFPDTIPTNISWLSGTSIAAATAAGNVAVWSLNRPGVFIPSNTTNDNSSPKPWLYSQLSDTYILSLSSGYPSRPNFLSITTGDGFSRLIDLRSPNVDSCTSARTRMLISSQAWHEHTQTWIMADEYYMLKHASLRRYYANSYTMKLDSSLVCCATSPVQPCILIGGADGTVAASNPTGKIINTKNPVWQQTWFKHEYRPPVEHVLRGIQHPPLHEDATSSSTSIPVNENDPVPQSVLDKPLTRITEGYTPQKVTTAARDETEQRAREGGNLIAIFEERSAVTKLAWNPNLKFGTWAVAGTHNGYLRVEDLSV